MYMTISMSARARRLPARIAATAALALAVLAATGCADAVSLDPNEGLFVIEVSGETFKVLATDQETVAALEARRASGSEGVINGALLAGDGGFNAPWSWHLDPTDLDVPDASIELCDGRPSMVEADMTYWLGTVGRFCPWGGRVVGRER